MWNSVNVQISGEFKFFKCDADAENPFQRIYRTGDDADWDSAEEFLTSPSANPFESSNNED